MILTADDLKRIDKKSVLELIEINRSRLSQWSIPNYEKEEIEKENDQLEKILVNLERS